MVDAILCANKLWVLAWGGRISSLASHANRQGPSVILEKLSEEPPTYDSDFCLS